MPATVLRVPVSLLVDPSLPASAKLTWMLIALHRTTSRDAPFNRTKASHNGGLALSTLVKGLALLSAAGWDTSTTIHNAPLKDLLLPIPAALLTSHELGIQAKLLYGLLQITPEFHRVTGRFTYPELSRLALTAPNTVKQAVQDLTLHNWLRTSQQHRLAPVGFALTSPALERGRAELARVQQRTAKAPFRGEAIMREYLSLLVDSDRFEDNVRPGFLINPTTQAHLELDRFYPPGVAFEFNGPQHSGSTARYSEQEAAAQQVRDLTKIGICATKSIRLIVIQAEDLSLEGMRAKIGDGLPLRDLEGLDPVIGFLARWARRHRAKVGLDWR